MSRYILPNEYVKYGLPTSTTDMQVFTASAIVDGYLRRPEGLIWQPDYQGQPCYMAGLTPTMTLNSAAGISAGLNVQVNPTITIQSNDLIGQVVILDRASPSLVEPCIVNSYSNGIITFASVAKAHSSNCTMDFGLTIMEERAIDSKRSITRVARPPLRLISGLGRYDYGRRLDQISGYYEDFNLLATMSTFGGPPLWIPFPTNQASTSMVTHEVWVPAGILLSYFSTVRLFYVSGYAQSLLPELIKQATAGVIITQTAMPELSGNISILKVGTTTITRTIASALSPDVCMMLHQFRAKLYV